MKKEQFDEIWKLERELFKKLEAQGETSKSIKAYEMLSELSKWEVDDKEMTLSEARYMANIAHDHEQKEICDYLDNAMGLAEGWLYSEESFCVTVSGKLTKKAKENGHAYITLSPFRIQYPTQKFADICESINNSELIIHDENGGGYLEATLSNISVDDYVLLEVFFSFLQHKDGRYEYEACICRNLTSHCVNGIFIPDCERLGVPFGFRPFNKSIEILPFKCLERINKIARKVSPADNIAFRSVRNPKLREYHGNLD